MSFNKKNIKEFIKYIILLLKANMFTIHRSICKL